MGMHSFWKLVVSLLIPQAVGLLGSIFTASSVMGWYQNIIKPELNPPAFVFGPVWNLLFILIGLSLYFVWIEKGREDKSSAFISFGVQMFLNLLWSYLFFGLKNPGLALIEIALLWVAIGVNIVFFMRIRKLAGYLLIPYLLWVSFALYLNYSIYILN